MIVEALLAVRLDAHGIQRTTLAICCCSYLQHFHITYSCCSSVFLHLKILLTVAFRSNSWESGSPMSRNDWFWRNLETQMLYLEFRNVKSTESLERLLPSFQVPGHIRSDHALPEFVKAFDLSSNPKRTNDMRQQRTFKSILKLISDNSRMSFCNSIRETI